MNVRRRRLIRIISILILPLTAVVAHEIVWLFRPFLLALPVWAVDTILATSGGYAVFLMYRQQKRFAKQRREERDFLLGVK